MELNNTEQSNVISTRDISAEILNRLTKEQLNGFIALFHDILPTKEDDSAKR